ncbi:MAG: DUF4252 domain-containing protein [Polaribacter sp.]
MKKSTRLLSIAFLLLLIVSACDHQKSLQAYIVNSSEKQGFMYGDLPVGLMLTPKEDASEAVKETIKSIKKMNVVFFKKTKENAADYEIEKSKLKNIFTNKTYKTLGVFKTKGMNMKLYYTGQTDQINEVIAFGYGKKVGVGVARLLGKNMNPARIMEMMNNIQLDTNMIQQGQFKTIFNGQ